MSELVFLSHLPLLRIGEETVPFAGGELWRLPFDLYNDLTLGAFSDHRRTYDAVAPVFYRVDLDLDLDILKPGRADNRRVLELKAPTNKWRWVCESANVSLLEGFQRSMVDPAWAALSLVCPSAAVPAPRLSVTFVHSAGDAHFEVIGDSWNTLRIQGDADQDYLFLPEAAGTVMPAEVLTRATQIHQLLGAIENQAELTAALLLLLAASSPLLNDSEQTTLAVMALEALLAPEVRSGSRAEFATRISRLLGVDDPDRAALKRIAQGLYDARSASVHGRVADVPGLVDGSGPQLLAAAVCELIKTGATEPLAEARTALETPDHAFRPGTPVPENPPPVRRPRERLHRGWSPVVAGVSGNVDMTAPKGSYMSWSPLIGLSTATDFAIGPPPCPVILPLNAEELLSMEERDIRRDHAAELYGHGQPAAVLLVGRKAQPGCELEIGEADRTAMLRERDLVTVALRCAGFTAFTDPDLLGAYLYAGSLRLRLPTILRQTILLQMRAPATQQIAAADVVRTAPVWQRLVAYDRTARCAEIDALLSLFRRSFDDCFLPAQARIGLQIAALESMLGRFRLPGVAIQLESLVRQVCGTEQAAAARWFETQGRKFRNDWAHGRLADSDTAESAAEHLAGILQAAVPALIECWLTRAAEDPRRPRPLFIDQVTVACR